MSKMVLTASETRALEQYVFQKQQVPSLVVMENAARAVSEHICRDFPSGGRCLLLCGTGNNGGDGFAIARQMAVCGWDVAIWALGNAGHRSPDAEAMLAAAVGSGVPICEIDEESAWCAAFAALPDLDVVVDAVFGIGLNRELSPFYQMAFRDVNGLTAKKYAVDIPSGVDADGGRLWGEAIQAECTVTFFAAKPGQLLYPGRKFAGVLDIARLHVDNDFFVERKRPQEWIMAEDIRAMLPPRKADAHKGDFGFGLLVGGSAGMVGAVHHAARAALRGGIGRLCVAAPKDVAPALWASLPEAMTQALDAMTVKALEPLVTGKSCAAIGPGMGRSGDLGGSLALFELLLASGLPVIFDADALHLLAEDVYMLKKARGEVLLTPHPGEMARLCGVSNQDILDKPLDFAGRLAEETGAVVLLKGGSSVIAAPDGRIGYNTSGGPALSKGGSGDVLCGLALAFLGQGLNAYDAACCAAQLLGLAAENVIMDEKSVLPGDIIEAIPAAFATTAMEGSID